MAPTSHVGNESPFITHSFHQINLSGQSERQHNKTNKRTQRKTVWIRDKYKQRMVERMRKKPHKPQSNPFSSANKRIFTSTQQNIDYYCDNDWSKWKPNRSNIGTNMGVCDCISPCDETCSNVKLCIECDDTNCNWCFHCVRCERRIIRD
eukprot:685634_1